MLTPGPDRFPVLFSPCRIGPMTVGNRIVCAPHQTEFSPDAWFTAQHVAYLEARAAGGAGWIVTEPVEAHPSARRELPPGRAAWNPGVVDAWGPLVEAVRRHGSRVTLTVGHAGPNTTGVESGQALWGPSEQPSPGAREVPAVMSEEMIAELIASIGVVAGHARAAGFDGVELQVTADYLFGAFLSSLTNDRTDAYGGDLEGRGRIVTQALDALRTNTAGELAVGLRISIDHLVPGGLRPDEAAAFLSARAADGLIDYVSCIRGTYHTLDHIIPAMGTPTAPLAEAARIVRAAVGVPVVIAGRIPDAPTMEALLADGTADLVASARLFIADPRWVEKVRGGDDALVRRCLYCNQLCVTQLLRRKPIRCVQNPDAGYEASRGSTHPPARVCRVLVVGAGPAGLEAACTLVERGHQVRVAERADEPGGRLRLARLLPGRAELWHAIEPRLAQLEQAGVRVEHGVTVDRSVVDDLDPDAVVLATGAKPYREPRYRGRPAPCRIDGLTAESVLTVDDVASDPPVGRRVLVIDEEGTRAVAALVGLLVDRDCHVVVVTTLPHVGYPNLILSQEWATTVPPLVARGMVVHPFSQVREVRDGRGRVERVDGAGVVEVDSIDDVVVAFGGTVPPGPDLGRPVTRVGDCVAPRDLGAALRDGRRLARVL
jgi:2,4-dienoyl-CoA reductase-like NADH-dependent reductase (Old Yellow Enzyme family)